MPDHPLMRLDGETGEVSILECERCAELETALQEIVIQTSERWVRNIARTALDSKAITTPSTAPSDQEDFDARR